MKTINLRLVAKKQAIDKDKDGVKYKYPARTCKECAKYPCFVGIEKKICDFAKYGCVDYRENKDDIFNNNNYIHYSNILVDKDGK